MDANQLPQSAYELIRAFPLDKAEKLWSNGKTIRKYPDEQEAPLPDWQNDTLRQHHKCYAGEGLCAIDKAELDHLIATSETFNPNIVENTVVRIRERTIDQELRALGFGVKNTDQAFETGDGEVSFEIVDPNAGITVDDRANQHYGLVPYVRPTPLTQRRIEWERRTKYSSQTIRLGIREKNDQARVVILGVQLSPEQRVEFAKLYLKRLLRKYGAIPTLEQIRAFNAALTELRDRGLKANLANLEPFAEEEYTLNNYVEGDEDPYREQYFDQELHDVAIVTAEPDPDYLIIENEETGETTWVEMPHFGAPPKRVLLRNHKPSRIALDYNPDDPFFTIDDHNRSVLMAYYQSLMPERGDYLASKVSIGLDMELEMTEWDLGESFDDEIQDLGNQAPDLEDPLSVLQD